MALCLVGMGISGTGSVPADGAQAMASAEIIYYERFTSPPPLRGDGGGAVDSIRGMAADGCIIIDAKRWMVEDGSRILEDAASKSVVLASYGDPLVATTHAELLCRAARAGIKTRVIHASSGPTSTIGECGLHHYKMGRMATVMRDAASMTTPYYTIYKNAVERCHTLLLLEYDHEGTESGDGCRFALEPADALRGLLRTEEGQRRRVISEETYAIVASRIGADVGVPEEGSGADAGTCAAGDAPQCITAGRVSSLIARGRFGGPPHSIIIPGRLHFTESDALAVLAECMDPPPQEPSPPNEPARIAEQMVAKYAPMIKRSVDEVAERCAGDDIMLEILDNARRYVSDAEDFVRREGHEDVAVLSIGYADGLADAIRQIHKMGTGSSGGHD